MPLHHLKPYIFNRLRCNVNLGFAAARVVMDDSLRDKTVNPRAQGIELVNRLTSELSRHHLLLERLPDHLEIRFHQHNVEKQTYRKRALWSFILTFPIPLPGISMLLGGYWLARAQQKYSKQVHAALSWEHLKETRPTVQLKRYHSCWGSAYHEPWSVFVNRVVQAAQNPPFGRLEGQ